MENLKMCIYHTYKEIHIVLKWWAVPVKKNIVVAPFWEDLLLFNWTGCKFFFAWSKLLCSESGGLIRKLCSSPMLGCLSRGLRADFWDQDVCVKKRELWLHYRISVLKLMSFRVCENWLPTRSHNRSQWFLTLGTSSAVPC